MGGKYQYLGLSLGMACFHVLPILTGIINIPQSFRIFLSALLAFKSSVFDYVSLSVSLKLPQFVENRIPERPCHRGGYNEIKQLFN